ncbi:unnamed protein product [Chondrus crispus]|uniref:Sulfhydryl oxidase n=1 Tax=Chondrus crispus TaxID=2769 RepID=R7QC60_CHOCR|nr:unnamed protein product [Chondrus crispus]CDF36087.1 unnamed protein product [Chondrus crispus]|eukprot:XP_005715906.1 unnamed protein product [Chondrus crispus]
MSSYLRGRKGIFIGKLVTVCGIISLLFGLLLDSTLPVEAGFLLSQPFQIVSEQATGLYEMARTSTTTSKPPSRKELGNAGWTLIHSIAANYPPTPSSSEQRHAKAFLKSIGKLYPCKRCRQHFSKYLSTTPPDLTSRDRFMLWACKAHNEVNRRQGKPEFPCQMQNLESRWGDCGCKLKK